MPMPYAATAISGTLGVEDVLSGKQIRDVTKGLYMIVDDNHLAPFVAITAKNAISRGPVAKNPYFEWTRKDIFPCWSAAITSDTAGTTSSFNITSGEGSFFKVGDVVEFPEMAISSTTTRVFYLTTVATDTLTFGPVGFQAGTTTALTCPAVNVGMKLHRIADASDEYSVMPTRKVVQDVQETNYIQFLRVPYVIGNLEMEMAQYTGPERAERRAETLREIKMEFERVLIWGERGYIAGSTGRKYFSRGLKSFLTVAAGDNLLDWSGGLTEAQLDEYLIEGPCKYGSQRKFWFMSSDLFLKVHSIAKAKERIVSTKINSMGLAVSEYVAPNGKILYMHQHYMFEEGYEGAGLIVDPDYIKIRPYGSQGVVKLHEEIQAPDAAGIADEWRIIAGLQVDRTEPHGWQYV